METLSIISTTLATFAMLLIVAGLIFARNKKKHIPLMMAAFACDIAGLIVIEVVARIIGETSPVDSLATDPNVMKSVHAAFATASLICYGFQISSGRKIVAGERTRLPTHKLVAKIFILTRLGAYVTMFMF